MIRCPKCGYRPKKRRLVTKKLAENILRLSNEGLSTRKIGKKLKLSHSAVANILRHKK